LLLQSRSQEPSITFELYALLLLGGRPVVAGVQDEAEQRTEAEGDDIADDVAGRVRGNHLALLAASGWGLGIGLDWTAHAAKGRERESQSN